MIEALAYYLTKKEKELEKIEEEKKLIAELRFLLFSEEGGEKDG